GVIELGQQQIDGVVTNRRVGAACQRLRPVGAPVLQGDRQHADLGLAQVVDGHGVSTTMGPAARHRSPLYWHIASGDAAGDCRTRGAGLLRRMPTSASCMADGSWPWLAVEPSPSAISSGPSRWLLYQPVRRAP